MKNSHSLLKNSFLSLLIIGVLTSTAYAHGPENHLQYCKEKYLDAWFEDNQGKASGACDPNNPPNIEAGITREYGGTTKNYPFGLCYPSFNNYTDSVDKAFDTPTGMDPYGTQPPLFKDERNFFKVRKWSKDGQTAKWVDYKDEVEVDYGDTLTFMLYIHNDGDPCFNEGNAIPKNKFYSNWNTTSRNTKVKVSPSPETKISNATSFNASIWSDNARNAKGEIAPTINGVVIKPKDNKELTLKYKVDSAAYTDYDQNWNFTEHDISNPQNLFTNNGLPLTTLLNGSPKSAIGVQYASEPYIGVIVFSVQVEEKPVVKTPICKNLTADLRKVTINNSQAYKINYIVDAEPGADVSKVTFTSTENGTFYTDVQTADNQTKYSAIGKKQITVDNGQNIYYLPTNTTDDVNIQVYITDKCKAEVKITGTPIIPTCEATTVTMRDLEKNTEVSCTLNKEYSVEAKFYEDAAKTKEISAANTIVEWSSTDPNGLFYNPLLYAFNTILGKETQGLKGPIQGPSTMKYVGRGTLNAKLVSINGKPYNDIRGTNVCAFSIPECTNSCRKLNLSYDTTPEVGKTSNLKFEAFDIFGQRLPRSTKIIVKTNTDATLTSQGESTTNAIQTTIDKSVEFKNSTTLGKITAEVSKEDPLYNEYCKEEVSLQEQLTCSYITATVDDQFAPTIKAGNFYKIKAKSTFSKIGVEKSITMKTSHGLFIVPKTYNQPSVDQAILSFAINTANQYKASLTSKDINTSYDNQYIIVGKEVTVKDEDTVLFIPFIDITLEEGINALTIQTTGRLEPECMKQFNIYPTDQVCKNLSFTTFPTKFDPTQDMVIRLNGSTLGDFKGNLEFKTTNGKFYYPQKESEKASTKTFIIEEAISGIIYTGGQYQDTVEIKAVGDLSSNCAYSFTNAPAEVSCTEMTLEKPSSSWKEEDVDDEEQEFILNIKTTPSGYENSLKYKWQANGGNFQNETTTSPTNTLKNIDFSDDVSISVSAINPNGSTSTACQLTKHLESIDDIDADIEKLVYDVQNKKWANTINVGGKKETSTAKGNFVSWLSSKYQYITYLATFDPGTAKSAEIWEQELRNGYITASNTKRGKLNYISLAIVVESNKGKKYTAYVSDKFDENRYNNQKINGKSTFRDFSNYSKNEDYFIKNFECGKNDNNEICIENIEDLESDFQKGRRIQLGNTASASKIHFIYQTQNDTAVTEQFCKTIIKQFQGCGEEFNNTINFTAYRRDNHSDELNDGKDSAKAIAICPYILTRQGGDVFFHNALDTGIDVSACYKVENCEGPCIKREQPKKNVITSTGSGNIEDIILSTPTHDVCKLSNDPNSSLPSAYKDVLKNFSSSVCEFKADVAAIWTEKNINKAIKSNIEKISRFTSNKGSHTFKSPSVVKFSNGVFVQDGGTLTIDGSPNYSINSNEPAAQTYIVKNGDLVIKSDIIYNDQNVDPKKPKSIPSVAFIVINGDIKIDNNVSRIDAILMSVDSENNGKGKVVSLQNSPTFDKILNINGSLIGDVANLFENRQAIGDPLKDQSSITIKYDERILLNTPPGLGELIDINQLKIAN
ncbi:hypothetical protein COU74_04225 [Candidatus Peregrinibacteria bacterium CG10_big_fil_rev_8_21_14_0_10_36_19]|nr:MAG: hypothetical protein COU74_04225 [Candidatus Peregrinibacteria bacterium CG10_big_fil_rev_8_21_14_0_10_36_19]